MATCESTQMTSTGRTASVMSRIGLSPRLFANRTDTTRARRAGDVMMAGAAVIVIALLILVAVPPAGFELDLISVINVLPGYLDGLWRFLLGAGGLWSLVLFIATLARRRLALLRDLIVVSLLTVVLGLIVGAIAGGGIGLYWSVAVTDASSWVPWLRITLPVAIIITTAPFLVRPARRLGDWLAGLAVISAVLLDAVPPTLALASLAVALLAASAVHLIFGSARGWPDVADVVSGMAGLGVPVVSVGPLDRQRVGVFELEATDPSGRRLEVKVYGRDASDTRFLSTLWRWVWLRGLEPTLAPGRLRQVEHEALLTLLAGQSDVPVPPVIMAGRALSGDAILVTAKTWTEIDQDGWDTELASGLWEILERLHRANIAHGHIEASAVARFGDRVGLVDFGTAVTAPSRWRLGSDRVQALVTSILAIGVEPALDVAIEALGHDGITQILPLLQVDVLTADQRRTIRTRDIDIDDLRKRAAERVGIEPPELEPIRRVTFSSVLRAALPILAFFAIASIVAGLDFEALGEALSGVSWGFLLVGLIVAQVPRVGQAISALGAAPIPLPLSRLLTLQLAQGYVALTIPGGAARIAMNTRFLQRHGLPPGGALAVGALDSFAGFMTQLTILGLVLVFSSLTVDLDLGSDVSSGMIKLLVVIVIVAVCAIAAVAAVPRWRGDVVKRARQLIADGRGALTGIGSPRRLGLLFGGNAITEVLMAMTLGAFCFAMGYPLGLPELLLIHIVVSIMAGVLPVPGGIGVVEGGILLFLARTGIPDESAFAIAILFRAATFYIPPSWGFFAFRWLERNKHL